MAQTIDVIELTQDLIQCPSVTPKDEGAQTLLIKHLEAMGFECYSLPFGEVPNLFARIGTKGPHICYGGHTDVVPPGPEDQWTYGPFNPHIEGNVLYGRGASDMKGSVAAFISACSTYLKKHGTPEEGSISLLITGDEEGPAIDGTVKVLEWMKENGHVPDVAIVGEPTNPSELGQEVKIGRRGSLTGTITARGKQGHVAYQHMADNPLPRLAKMVDALSSYEFDQGSDHFLPTNLEFTTIDVGNPATNVIPESGTAIFNIRFNDHWSGQKLGHKIKEILNGVSTNYEIEISENSESFLTEPGEWTNIVVSAVEDITGKKPAMTTTGGTSDARFVTHYCPVVEFGPINATIHQINENSPVDALRGTAEIYTRVLERYFKV